jgi:hypothetical protein
MSKDIQSEYDILSSFLNTTSHSPIYNHRNVNTEYQNPSQTPDVERDIKVQTDIQTR